MPIEVILNVYDLIDQTPICCGFFHTGVEILGTEYSFAGGAGIYDCPPRSAPDGRFRQGIVLGTVDSTSVARAALDRLRPEFHGDAYSLIFKNCNDFSSAYAKALLGRDIPGYVNRLARMGRAWPIRCFLPSHLKAGGGNASAQAPLLARQQLGQGHAAPLFQGEGRSLSGTNVGPAGGGCQAGGGRFARTLGWLRRGSAGACGSGDTVRPGSDARELRAAAAARRLSDVTSDVEVGISSNSGRAGNPMPNPWQ